MKFQGQNGESRIQLTLSLNIWVWIKFRECMVKPPVIHYIISVFWDGKLWYLLGSKISADKKKKNWLMQFEWSLYYSFASAKAVKNKYLVVHRKHRNLITGYVLMKMATFIFYTVIQGDSFDTRPKKMRISQRLFIRFWTPRFDGSHSFIAVCSNNLHELLKSVRNIRRPPRCKRDRRCSGILRAVE